MLTNRVLNEASLANLLSVVISNFHDQGVICEMTSSGAFSFSSTLPERSVKEIFQASSVPLKVSFESSAQGCRGAAQVDGIPRVNE